MTVKELIDILSKFPPEMRVTYLGGENGRTDVHDVEVDQSYWDDGKEAVIQ